MYYYHPLLWTYLWQLCHYNCLDIFCNIRQACAVLIEMGAEISARDDVNWTPLDYAAFNGHRKVLSLLLDNDAPVDACDSNKSTPLHHASCNGHEDCVGILLNYGASISHKNSFNKNCLDLAVENGQVDVCRTLVKHERYTCLLWIMQRAMCIFWNAPRLNIYIQICYLPLPLYIFNKLNLCV